MSDSINLFESYLEIYEGKPVAAPADEPNRSRKGFGFNEFGEFVRDRKGGEDLPQRPPQKARVVKKSATKKLYKENNFNEGNRFEREYKVPNWDKVQDRNTRDYGRPSSNRKRKNSGKMETDNQVTQRLGKERVSDHKATRGVKQIKGGKGVQMYFGRNVFTKVEEDLEYLLDYIVSEGYVDTYDSAIPILESMSDEWLEDILDESYKELPVDKMIAKSKSLARIPRESGAPRWDRNAQRGSDIRKTAGTHSRAKVKKVEKENRERGMQKEQVDLYDIILSHLLDEGYADTVENAEVIMVNMSEDWREDILNEVSTPKQQYQNLVSRMKNSKKKKEKKRLKGELNALNSTRSRGYGAFDDDSEYLGYGR